MKKKFRILVVTLVMLFVVAPQIVFAYSVQSFDNMPVEGDLILGPGKTELLMSPGEETTREISVTNRTGKTLEINVDVEDFTGDPQSSTKLLGQEIGPYSLRDFIKPERTKFTLAHGEKAKLSVNISIPDNAEPGGLYGAAIIRAKSSGSVKNEKVDSAKGQIDIVSRLAELFFVRIKGVAKEDGYLKSFSSGKYFYQQTPVSFNVAYENTGKVHLNPYAEIEISNFLGKKIDTIEVSPWFVMPGFSRDRVISWDRGIVMGRYTAKLTLHRGYGDLSDTASVSFWVIPFRILMTAILVIVMLSVIIWWFSSKFEIKKK